ncbi:hypothetical protein [Clostridium simiarum]|nr:hypothetical protein [Clostridium simiarum]
MKKQKMQIIRLVVSIDALEYFLESAGKNLRRSRDFEGTFIKG